MITHEDLARAQSQIVPQSLESRNKGRMESMSTKMEDLQSPGVDFMKSHQLSPRFFAETVPQQNTKKQKKIDT